MKISVPPPNINYIIKNQPIEKSISQYEGYISSWCEIYSRPKCESGTLNASAAASLFRVQVISRKYSSYLRREINILNNWKDEDISDTLADIFKARVKFAGGVLTSRVKEFTNMRLFVDPCLFPWGWPPQIADMQDYGKLTPDDLDNEEDGDS